MEGGANEGVSKQQVHGEEAKGDPAETDAILVHLPWAVRVGGPAHPEASRRCRG